MAAPRTAPTGARAPTKARKASRPVVEELWARDREYAADDEPEDAQDADDSGGWRLKQEHGRHPDDKEGGHCSDESTARRSHRLALGHRHGPGPRAARRPRMVESREDALQQPGLDER